MSRGVGKQTTAPRRMAHRPTGQLETIRARRERVFELRRDGLTYKEIAAELGISNVTALNDCTAVMREVHERTITKATELRALEHARLERLLRVIRVQVDRGDLFAIDRALAISEQIRKMYGLDKITANLNINTDLSQIHPDLSHLTVDELTEFERLQTKVISVTSSAPDDTDDSTPTADDSTPTADD